MARGQPDEETYQPRVQPEDLPRKVIPEMSSASIGPGISQVADTLEKKYQADSATWAGDQIAKARTQALATLQTAKDNLPAGQDPGDFGQSYLKSFDDQTKDLTQNDQVASNPYARQMIQKGMNEFRETMAQHVFGYEAAQRVAYREDSLQKNLQSQAMVVQAHPELKDQVASTLTDQANSIGGDASTRLARMRAIDSNISNAAVDGYTRQSPQAMLDALKDPESAPAPVKEALSRLTDAQREVVRAKAGGQVADNYSDSVVSAYRSQGPQAGASALQKIDGLTIDPDIKRQIYSNAEKGINQWHEEAQQKFAPQIMALEEHIGSGTADNHDIAAIHSLYNSGAIASASTAGEAIGRIQKSILDKIPDTGMRDFVSGAVKSGQALDPMDKDLTGGMADAFTQATQGVPAGSQAWINRGVYMAGRTGITPKPMIDWARTQLVSGTPESKVQAAQTIAQLQDSNPNGTPYALKDDKETLTAARVINDAVKAGSAPPDAVALQDKLSKMSDAEKTALEQSYKTNKVEKTTQSSLVSLFNADKSYKASGFFGSVPAIPPVMLGQYEQLRQDYYKSTGGNVQQASALAQADLKNTWGVSEVNGKREFMQYAPESQHVGMTADTVQKAMHEFVQGQTGLAAPDSLHLTQTVDTAATGGQKWAVSAPGKYGNYEPLLDKQNNPLVFTLPTASKLLKSQATSQILDQMEQTRAQQARDNADEGWLKQGELAEKLEQRAFLNKNPHASPLQATARAGY